MGPKPESLDSESKIKWLQEDDDEKKDEMVKYNFDFVLDSDVDESQTEVCETVKQNNRIESNVDLPDLIKDSSNPGKILNKKDILPPHTVTDLSTQGNHYIQEACVSGFVPVKHGPNEVTDIAFIVAVTWSDGTVHMIKRTFSDFHNLHFYLLDEWETDDGKIAVLKLTFYLPERQNGETEPSIEVAECRELQLNKYVQELIKLPQQISASPTVLTFFESRGSDPKPYRETVNPSQMELADQYVLCWI